MSSFLDANELALYKSILENEKYSVLLLSEKGKILIANQNAVDMYGYSREELLNMSITDLSSKEKPSELNLEKLDNEDIVTVHCRKNGESFSVEIKFIDINIENEHFVLSIVKDVTLRLNLDKEIGFLASIVNSSDDAIISKTLDGVIISWNKAAEILYGYSKDEVIGKNISIIIPEDRQGEFEEILSKIKRGERIDNFRTLRKRKNGDLIHVSITISPINNLDGKLIGASTIARDITTEVKLHDELQKSEEKYRLLYKTMSQGAAFYEIIQDGNGNPVDYRFLDVNDSFEKITGKRAKDIIGKTISQVFPETEVYWVKQYGEVVLSRKSKKFESYIKELNKYIDVFVYCPRVGQVAALFTDITERKILIDNLNKKNIELENALKSLKEAQMHLVQEDKMASIGQLSSGIAHEINNPLGFVLSNFNTLKKYMDKFKEYIFEYRKLKEKLEECCLEYAADKIESINDMENKNKIDYILGDLEDLYKDTEDGLNRIKKIVMALRNFAHENINNSFEDYNLNEGINNTLIIAKNEIKYTTEIKTNLSDIPLIKAKPSEINQVLLNLIINSSHAIKEKIKGKPDFLGEIYISTWNDENFVYCCIEDNGTGISEENISKVFDPFFTTKPVGKGTGLGLSISYDIIVNKHKGDIKIESRLNEGTKITISIPINQEKGE